MLTRSFISGESANIHAHSVNKLSNWLSSMLPKNVQLHLLTTAVDDGVAMFQIHYLIDNVVYSHANHEIVVKFDENKDFFIKGITPRDIKKYHFRDLLDIIKRADAALETYTEEDGVWQYCMGLV